MYTRVKEENLLRAADAFGRVGLPGYLDQGYQIARF
jgi:hypothetical protein